ncbi:MAG: hypothetical protein KDD15_32995, partial [Lewinella sp.]|nr:hypothetical protein [Lewinella sp.]
MKKENVFHRNTRTSLNYFMQTKNWWGPLVFILIISLAGVGMIGYQTYNDAPPTCDFVQDSNDVLISKAGIERGQIVFHKYALMEYGSFFGDGAQRGPDYTAEALHQVVLLMTEYRVEAYRQETGREPTDMERKVIGEEIREETKENRYDEEEDIVALTNAQAYAIRGLRTYYTNVFIDANTENAFPPPGYISDRQEVSDLSDFFFWGAWVCSVERPGVDFSYTHNWPY